MNGISTITQKGQVVIPLSIRRFLGLEASDRLYFEVEKGVIVAKPIDSIEEAMGMIEAKKKVSKNELKKTVTETVLEKFK
jgi:AbrB family looped-hinge helix DNA binding protein